MEFLSIAHVLRRHRILVAVGLVAAIAFGAMVGGVGPPRSAPATKRAGVALTQVLIDTRVPLVATTTRGADDTIVQRSVLLAELMQSDASTAMIAQRAGLRPDALAVVGPTFPPVSEFSLVPDGQLPQVAATAAQTSVTAPDVVQLLPNYTVPILSISAAAPDVHDAVALVQATIATLRSATVPTSASRTSSQAAARGRSRSRPPAPQAALDIVQLGVVRSAAGPGAGRFHLLLGAGAIIALLAAWSAGIVITTGFARMWQRLGDPATQSAV